MKKTTLASAIALTLGAMGLIATTAQAQQNAAGADAAARAVQEATKGAASALVKSSASANQNLDELYKIKRQSSPVTGNALSIDVAGFNVVGLTVATKVSVDAVLAKHVGKGKKFEDLEVATEDLQRMLRQEGLFLAVVDIPAQKLNNGIVQLRVMEGRLDKVELAPIPKEVAIREDWLREVLGTLQPGDLLTVEKIERTLLLASDLRGIVLNSVIEPGSRPGTVKLVIRVTPGKSTETSVTADNFGSSVTGKMRYGANLDVNSPGKVGDLVRISASMPDTGLSQFARVAYQRPVNAQGLKVGVSLAAVRYRLAGSQFDALLASGNAQVYTAFGLYPIKRSRNANMYAQLSFDRREFRDIQQAVNSDNSKSADVLTMGLVADSRDQILGGGINSVSLGVVQGRLSINTPVQLAADQASTGNKTDGHYKKFTYSIARQQLLWADEKNSADRLVVYGLAHGQTASKNLDGSEKSALGGITGVRGYAGGEASGDAYRAYTLELRKNIIANGVKGDLVASLFYDWGETVLNRKPLLTQTTANQITLLGRGLGLAWSPSSDLLVKATYAFRGDYVPATTPNLSKHQFYMSLAKSF